MATHPTTVSSGVEARSVRTNALRRFGADHVFAYLLVGCADTLSKQTIGYRHLFQGVPLASLAVPLSGLFALVGGLSILLGYRAEIGAWLIVIFLMPVTLMMHKFWTVSDPIMAQMQLAMFMKNLALLGSALLISQFGSGLLGLDSRRSR